MCPARAAFDIRQIIITLVSIRLQTSAETPVGKMLHGTLPLSLCNGRAGSAEVHLPTAEEPHPGIRFRITPAHSVPGPGSHLPSDIYASVTDGENNHKHDGDNFSAQ